MVMTKTGHKRKSAISVWESSRRQTAKEKFCHRFCTRAHQIEPPEANYMGPVNNDKEKIVQWDSIENKRRWFFSWPKICQLSLICRLPRSIEVVNHIPNCARDQFCTKDQHAKCQSKGDIYFESRKGEMWEFFGRGFYMKVSGLWYGEVKGVDCSSSCYLSLHILCDKPIENSF